MKFIFEDFSGLSHKELTSLYKKYKKERLILVYELKYSYKKELDKLKGEIIKCEKELKKELSQAQYDRENCELGYNEVLLSIN